MKVYQQVNVYKVARFMSKLIRTTSHFLPLPFTLNLQDNECEDTIHVTKKLRCERS